MQKNIIYFFIVFFFVIRQVYSENIQNEKPGLYKNSIERLTEEAEVFYYPLTAKTTYHAFYIPIFNPHMSHLKQGMKWGAGIDIAMTLIQKKLWKYWNIYPAIGLTFNYYQFGNFIHKKKEDKHKIQGKAIGAMLYVDSHYDYQKTICLVPRFGIGWINLNIPLDKTIQDIKKGISSANYKKNTLHILCGFNMHIQLLHNMNLTAGIHYNYIPLKDSASQHDYYRKLQFISGNLSLGYTFYPQTTIYHQENKKKHHSRVHIGTTFALPKYEKKHQPIVGIYGKYSAKLFPNSALSIATEVIRDERYKKILLKKYIKSTSMRVSMLVGYEYWLGPLVLRSQVGCDVFNLNDQESDPLNLGFPFPVYGKLGLDLVILKNLLLGSSIRLKIQKDNKGEKIMQKDYWEFSIGYILGNSIRHFEQ